MYKNRRDDMITIKNDFKNISKHYKQLVKITKQHYFVGITNEWIVDNYYLLIKNKSGLKQFLKDSKQNKYLTKNCDMIKMLSTILENRNYKIDEDILIGDIKNYCKQNNINLIYQEIKIIPVTLLIILIKKISEICTKENEKLKEKQEIDQFIKKMKVAFSKNEKVFLTNYIKNDFYKNNFKIVYLNEKLKDLGNNANIIFKQLNQLLEKNNLSLRKIINDDHLYTTGNNILVSNVFYSIQQASQLEIENLYEKLCPVEKILSKDPCYSSMTLETKNLYRKQLIKLAKKENENIIDVANTLIAQDENIGAFLFPNKNQKLKVIIYLAIIVILTILIASFLSNYFLSIRWLGFIILLIPVSEIVITILSKIYLKIYPCKPIPKLDFEKGIPAKYKTMVVIPTILRDEAKVEEVFNKLESYYLSNKSQNLYFTLLGDACECSNEFYEKDEAIKDAGINKTKELNKKYGKEIFFFAYRTRKYSKSENCFLGFERKRGALLHFNDLILGNFDEEEQKNWFQIHTFQSFKHEIKYVITLDVDTQLVLNSALKLVGTMAHPLNTPVLNAEKTKVIQGYGILQPKINFDIESTNKSLFSQIYTGMGGLDPYTGLEPNFYQDVFKEGSFIGKGIYDLKVYQQILKGKFPNELILSHDLIEGNYLRCGVCTDIELIDDFPTEFLVDATRRSRWTRGDMQIIDWVTNKVKNENNEKIKNPIDLLGRWKIIDNIRRELLDFSLLLIILSLAICCISHPYWWLVFVLCIVMLPAISYLIQLFVIQKSANLKYYNTAAFGYKSFLLRTISVFTAIPYNAYLYVKSILKSIYRMTFSKKHLLQWMTAEDAGKQVKMTLGNHLKEFWFNYLIALLIIVISILSDNHPVENTIISLFFILGPFFAYAISKSIKAPEEKIKPIEQEHLLKIANATWKFFEDNLSLKNNYLIPDNYQLNREHKADFKTSPTNIGLSLTSIISAYELKFIDKDKMLDYIDKIITTIEKLPKWNGHLYNWYRIDTLEILYPHFISTVDSGNFVASLITIKEFFKNQNEDKLVKRITTLIDQTNFSHLYSEDVFSIGYNVDEGLLDPCKYNMFASESRITSFVAIAKCDVPSKHWFNLDKTLTTYKNRKGLVSWSGTSFEYFMPLLFIPSYENTLIDESYDFAIFAQKEFMKEVNSKLPWGISESAYGELDDSQNYKYKAFATPYLKLQEEPSSRIVIAPYGSILALSKYPKEVLNNIKKLEELKLFGKYGFYESYDTEINKPVYSYFAHHQGMILGSIANTLCQNIIQKCFNQDTNNHAFEILTKEKVQLKPVIDMNMAKYQKFTYEKEQFVNDIRVFHKLATLPEISILSNSKYSVLINDRGNGFSRYRMIQMNRYRKLTEQDYGMYIYIKDIATGKIWCNTYAPINKMPERYEVVFALDRMKFIRSDNDIITTTEIVVPKTHHAEIRKVTFKNVSPKSKTLEITTYTEPILCENNDDISHKAFQNLFIQSEYNEENDAIIMHRKLRDKNDHYYMVNRLLITNPNQKYSYETNRANFIGRNRTNANPIALEQKLTNQIGTCVDPVVSLRNQITIPANGKKTVYLISGFGKSKEQVIDIVETFATPEAISEKAFAVATIMSNVTSKMVDITGNDMRVYNTMLNYLYQTSHIEINTERNNILKQNKLNQTNLWRFGISGDRPIVFLEIESLDDLSLVKELLHTFEYYKSKSVFIDLIILNCKNKEEKQIINKEIDEEKYRMYALNSFHKTPGNIYVIDPNDINTDEYVLFKTVARLYIDSHKFHSLEEFVNNLQKLNTTSRKEKWVKELSLPITYDENKLTYYNGFGGFASNGKKYVITNSNTPFIWCNVLANPHFGSIISNNQTGFSYSQNSHEYKLTAWTNDNLLSDISEGIKINDVQLDYAYAQIGFGNITWKGRFKNLDVELKQFVAVDDPIKFYKIKIKNNGARKQRICLKYWLNPCLGETEEKTGRYIQSDFNKNENYVSLINKYSINFSSLTTFISCTLPITDFNTKRLLYKEIETSIYIDAKEEYELAFMLGTSDSDILSILKKYNTINKIKAEEKKVDEYWKEMLEIIQVKTPDDSFNYMLNGWLVYQTIASRLFAKAGFYQVGGAYGYRDQLQDAMNICTIHPEITRRQILWHARHQFEEGDVLHWWHKENQLGLRSRYKDDYLWLVYAVEEYIRITNDVTILNESVPFVTGPNLEANEMEKGINYEYSTKRATLYEHCLLAVEKAKKEIGKNGLCLMGGGDWNDGMNKVGEKGRGTSVWLTLFLYQVIDKFIFITNVYDKKIKTVEWENLKEQLKEAVRNVAWDGKYYLRAFFDNGHKLGSKDNFECKIDLISQSFAILTEIASQEQIPSILNAIDEQLIDKNLKIVRLLSPAFEKSEDNPGYIMNYPPGIRENGGQYTHAVAWYIQSLIKVGQFDLAYQLYQMINPIERSKTMESAQKYKLEPYVIAADIYSNKNFEAQGGWNWYTGAAGWFYRVALLDILGFKKYGNKLFIDPHIPHNWEKFEIDYKFENTKYHILIEKNGNKKIICDGKTTKNQYIELKNDDKSHDIIVYLGGKND